MRYLHRLLIGILTMAALFCIQPTLADDSAAQKWQRFEERRDEIYEHMARYGINRDDMDAMRRLREMWPHPDLYQKILAEKVLKPGEHYRFELDQHILTMVVPDAIVGSSWIVPYADTRTEPERDAALKKSKGGLEVANLGWEYGTGIWPLFVGWQGRMSISIVYDAALVVENAADISTPEKLREFSSKIQKRWVPSQEKIDDAARTESILNSAGTRVYLDTETTVINGRVWTREALNTSYGRTYKYKTVLLPDRMLAILVRMPQYDYNGNADASTYPAPLKRAFAQMETMMASLRVAKRNDDGAPDPFVIERVDPAPLPIREQLPR